MTIGSFSVGLSLFRECDELVVISDILDPAQLAKPAQGRAAKRAAR
ncbi:MAG: hypothetical protein ACYDB7_08445 [Mycobacteriales bacterium]